MDRIGDASGQLRAVPARMLRIAERTPGGEPAPYLDQQSAWLGSRTLQTPWRWNRVAVEALLGRLGFDPEIAWPRLLRGDVCLESMAETLAPACRCDDDPAFVRRVFSILIGRQPGQKEEAELVALLRAGMPRLRLIGRITKFDEFRGNLER